MSTIARWAPFAAPRRVDAFRAGTRSRRARPTLLSSSSFAREGSLGRVPRRRRAPPRAARVPIAAAVHRTRRGDRGECLPVYAAADASLASGDAPNPPSPFQRAVTFARDNYFLVGMLSCVAAASLAPEFGANGGPLRPEITVNKIAVRAMFLISGMNLPLAELRAAVTNVRANLLIQTFIFGVAGVVVALAAGPALSALGLLTPRLIDGLVVLACLPTTIGSGVALTNAAEGNVAISLFHAVFSNLAGIAVTPALIFLYLGADGAAVGSAGAAAGKLASQVLGPVLVGMAIRSAPSFAASLGSKPVKSKLKLASDGIILAIIYNTFCNTFKGGFGVAAGEVSALFAILAALLAAYKAAIFFAANAVGLARRDAVAAVYMGSQKTLAFGLPLIKALFEGSPDLAWLCLPALVYHPMQIALGSALVPRLRSWASEGESAGKPAGKSAGESAGKSQE